MAGKPRHGMANSSEYQAWADMKTRCSNPKNKRYKDYGGRGIKVCDRWLNSFENFYSDMGPKPSKEYSIDRLENSGDYTPENCAWRTRDDQYNNRRPNCNLTYKDKTQSLTRWAKELNISVTTLSNRIHTMNLEITKAFETPIRQKYIYITWNGQTKTISEWSRITGIQLETLRRRLNSNWDIEEMMTKKPINYRREK